jgi:beta-lactam-binding protein with PASTA domain
MAKNAFYKIPVIVHLLAALAVVCLVTFTVLYALDGYTRHNQAVIVPDVIGRTVDEAKILLDKNRLRFNVIDSVFSKDVKPGAIVDINPAAGSKVKEGRIVSVTVNSSDVEKAPIPDVFEVSVRQAYALLVAQGFQDIKARYVPGEYKDLVLGVELGGEFLEKGDLVPLSSMILLLVSDGGQIFDNDSTEYVGDEEFEPDPNS